MNHYFYLFNIFCILTATFQVNQSLFQGCSEFRLQVCIQDHEFSIIHLISMFFVQLEFSQYFPRYALHLTQLTMTHFIIDYD